MEIELAEVITQFGRRIVERPKELRAALSDLTGASTEDRTKEIDAVVAASEGGVAVAIRDSDPSVPATAEQIQGWFDDLVARGLSLRDAALATRSWATAFNASETARLTTEMSEHARGDEGAPRSKGSVRPAAPDDVTVVDGVLSLDRSTLKSELAPSTLDHPGADGTAPAPRNPARASRSTTLSQTPSPPSPIAPPAPHPEFLLGLSAPLPTSPTLVSEAKTAAPEPVAPAISTDLAREMTEQLYPDPPVVPDVNAPTVMSRSRLPGFVRNGWVPAIAGGTVIVAALVVGALAVIPNLIPAEPGGQKVVAAKVVPAARDSDVALLVVPLADLRKLIPTPTSTTGLSSFDDAWFAKSTEWISSVSGGCAPYLMLMPSAVEGDVNPATAYGGYLETGTTALYSFARSYLTLKEAEAAYVSLNPDGCGAYTVATTAGAIAATNIVTTDPGGTTKQGLVWKARRSVAAIDGVPNIAVDRWCAQLDRLVTCTTAWGQAATLSSATTDLTREASARLTDFMTTSVTTTKAATP